MNRSQFFNLPAQLLLVVAVLFCSTACQRDAALDNVEKGDANKRGSEVSAGGGANDTSTEDDKNNGSARAQGKSGKNETTGDDAQSTTTGGDGNSTEAGAESEKVEKPIKLPCAIAKASDVTHSIVIPGVVAPLPDHAVKVSPALAGKLVAVFVVPGQKVGRGQLIAKLDDRHIKDQIEQADVAIQTAKSSISQTENNLSFARENLERTKKLFSAEVAAKKDILLAENQVQAAEAQLVSAKAQVTTAQTNKKQFLTELTYTEVKSPLAGVVATRLLNAGDTADPNTAIAQIVQLDRVVINAALPADSPERVKAGEHATIKEVAHAETAFDAVVTAVSPMVDTQSNTINVELQCQNKGMELRDGQTVNVSIVCSVDRHKILIPKTALVPDPEHPNEDMVYVVANGKARRVSITKGNTTGRNVEILNGLKGGVCWVCLGAYGLPNNFPVIPTEPAKDQ